jgi:hypothetical protein
VRGVPRRLNALRAVRRTVWGVTRRSVGCLREVLHDQHSRTHKTRSCPEAPGPIVTPEDVRFVLAASMLGTHSCSRATTLPDAELPMLSWVTVRTAPSPGVRDEPAITSRPWLHWAFAESDEGSRFDRAIRETRLRSGQRNQGPDTPPRGSEESPAPSTRMRPASEWSRHQTDPSAGSSRQGYSLVHDRA